MRFSNRTAACVPAADDGWGMYHRVPKYTAKTYLESTLGKLREVLTEYGPVSRFWCGTHVSFFAVPFCDAIFCDAIL